MNPFTYTAGPARYAKGKIAVACPSDDMFKTAAAFVATDVGGSFSHREKAYLMSPRQFEKFELLVKNRELKVALKNLYEHPIHMKDCAFLENDVNTCDCARGKAVAQAYEVLAKLGV